MRTDFSAKVEMKTIEISSTSNHAQPLKHLTTRDYTYPQYHTTLTVLNELGQMIYN